MSRIFRTLSVVCFLLVAAGTVRAEEAVAPARILRVTKIWDAAPHNAFTDLVHHNGRFWCVFREGMAHVSPDGSLRVLSSPDGRTWESAARVTSDTADLRDAKILVTPDNRLCLAGAGAWHQPKDGITHQSFVWYSADGKDWGQALPIGDPNFWLWRIVWHQGKAYSIGYDCSKGAHSVRLYRSDDGQTFQPLVQTLNKEGYVNEAGMLFLPNDTFLTVLRRDNKPAEGMSTDALLGMARPPYTDWSFRGTGVRIGGPQILQLKDGRIVVGGRDYTGKVSTRLWWLNPEAAALKEIATLPSGGDTSYPGLVEHEGTLWVSYYSQHEGKCSIYLAEIALP